MVRDKYDHVTGEFGQSVGGSGGRDRRQAALR
jgi:hypothetical protein